MGTMPYSLVRSHISILTIVQGQDKIRTGYKGKINTDSAHSSYTQDKSSTEHNSKQLC